MIHALINHAYYDMARLRCPSILEACYFSEFEPGSMYDPVDELNDLLKILSSKFSFYLLLIDLPIFWS
jgi:hypothetical protein